MAPSNDVIPNIQIISFLLICFSIDDHDVLKLSVSSLRSPESAQGNNPSSEDADSKKIEEEFEQYQEKLKQQKAEWEKEHPDQVRIILIVLLDIFEGKDFFIFYLSLTYAIMFS